MTCPSLVGVDHVLPALAGMAEGLQEACGQAKNVGIERLPQTVNFWAQIYATVPRESREFYVVNEALSHQPMMRIFLEDAPWEEKKTVCSVELFWFGVAEMLWDSNKRIVGVDHLLRYTTPTRRKDSNGKVGETFDFGFGSSASLEWHFIQGPHFDKYLSAKLPGSGLDVVVLGTMHTLSLSESWKTTPIVLSQPKADYIEKGERVKTLYKSTTETLAQFAENQ